MIETFSNAAQIVLSGLCAVCAAWQAYRTRGRTWTLLALFSGVYCIGDLYWLLWLVFYRDSPDSEIPYLSWYAAYLFLFLLLMQVKSESRRARPHWLLWCAPAFTAGMFIYFIQFGDWFGNIVSAVLMGLLLWETLSGLLFLRGKRGAEARNRWLYWASLLFCASEYGLWIASCIWEGQTLANPYFWIDLLLSLCFPFFFIAVGKAADA